MKKSEIFQIILDVVCGCVEVTPNDVLSECRKEDVVTARCLIAAYCKDYHFSNSHIQQFLHYQSHNSVRNLLDQYESRRSYDRSFRFYDQTAAHELDKTMSAICQ